MMSPRRTLHALVLQGIVIGAILFGALWLIERWTDRIPHLNEARSIWAPSSFTGGRP